MALSTPGVIAEHGCWSNTLLYPASQPTNQPPPLSVWLSILEGRIAFATGYDAVSIGPRAWKSWSTPSPRSPLSDPPRDLTACSFDPSTSLFSSLLVNSILARFGRGRRMLVTKRVHLFIDGSSRCRGNKMEWIIRGDDLIKNRTGVLFWISCRKKMKVFLSYLEKFVVIDDDNII